MPKLASHNALLNMSHAWHRRPFPNPSADFDFACFATDATQKLTAATMDWEADLSSSAGLGSM
jgi:hypothetical protein